MLNRLTAAAVTIAGLAAIAPAQSLDGRTFTWSLAGVGIPNVTETATVGDGPEIQVIDTSLVAYDIDVDDTGITITPTFLDPATTRRDWGVVAGQVVGSLTLTFDGLPRPITGATVTGDAGDGDDVSFTAYSVQIGASSIADGDNALAWEAGDVMRIDLSDDLACPWVMNETTGFVYTTIGDAIAASSDGDTLELGPCTFNERGLLIESRRLTIRGQGPGVTAIDGGNIEGSLLTIQRDAAVDIEALTIQNGLNATGSGGGVVNGFTSGTNGVFRDVHFKNNQGNPLDGPISMQNGTYRMERCVFRGNTVSGGGGPGAFTVRGTADVTLVNCVIDETEPENSVLVFGVSPTANIVNCTFVGQTQRHILAFAPSATLSVVNSVFRAGPIAIDGDGDISVSRCLYQGATGDNIDGVPRFVNLNNGNFRLASGSPGVDGGDFDAYASAGGGLFDAGGGSRFFDDPNAPNFDPARSPIDLGAFERQAAAGPEPDPCLADLSGDGVLDLTDINVFTSEFLRGCD